MSGRYNSINYTITLENSYLKIAFDTSANPELFPSVMYYPNNKTRVWSKDDSRFVISCDDKSFVLDYTLCTTFAATDIEDFLAQLVETMSIWETTTNTFMDQQQYNANGLIRYKMDRGDSEFAGSFYRSFWLDGSKNNTSSSPATTTERTAGLPNATRCPFNRTTFPTPDGVGYTFYIASTSANDTYGGSGCNVILMQGLDANWDQTQEFIVMAGQTGVATAASNWLRVNRIYVGAVGPTATNEGDIYVTTVNDFSSGVPQTNVVNVVQMHYSISTTGIYSIPRYYRLYYTEGLYFVDATPLRNFESHYYRITPPDPSTPNVNRIAGDSNVLTISGNATYKAEGVEPDQSCADLEFTVKCLDILYTYGDKLNVNDFTINKFGRNSAIGTSFDVIAADAVTNFLTSAVNIEILSSNAEDDIAGLGARKVAVQGLDAEGYLIEEEIDLVGNSASASSTNQFIRVFRAHVTEIGTYGGRNYNDLMIRVAGGGADMLVISGNGGIDTNVYGNCQTQTTQYTIPKGFTGYLKSIQTTVDSLKTTELKLFQRRDILNTTTSMRSDRLVWENILTENSVTVDFPYLLRFPELTDIWLEAKVDQTTSTVTANYNLVLIEDITNNYSIYWNCFLIKDQATFGGGA